MGQSMFRDNFRYTQEMAALSSILIICFAITPYCMGSDTPDLTQDFLQNTLEFLYEIDQNQYENENENASANVVIKTFRSAIKTLIDECKKSIRKLEFIYEKDKNQQEKENLNGNVPNRTITRVIEEVMDESENSTREVYEIDKNQHEKEDLNGNLANRTITNVIEAVIDESENSMSETLP